VLVDPKDRAPVRQVSGQDLVPTLVFDDGEVVFGSMEVVRGLDEKHPEHPLYPADRARRAEMLLLPVPSGPSKSTSSRCWTNRAVAAAIHRIERDG